MYAVIYDHGPEDEPIEEYYEAFATPELSYQMFRQAFPKDSPEFETRNARLVKILGPIDDYAGTANEPKTEFVNHYHCEACSVAWSDNWSCACDDRCPKCNASINPYNSVEVLAQTK